MTPRKAVLLGHAFVNLPVLVFLGSGTLLALLIKHSHAWIAMPIGGGIVAGWLWWSATVPRWRRWVKQSGVDELKTEFLAVQSGLI